MLLRATELLRHGTQRTLPVRRLTYTTARVRNGTLKRICRIRQAAYVGELTQVALVTGGNAGIGLETVRWLLKKNAKVYMASRSKQRAEEAIAKLEKENLPGKVVFIQLDLADINNIKGFPSRFQEYEDHLDLLFNNAGLTAFKPNQVTKDGYEIQIGTNSLGPHYLTRLMIPFLEAALKQTPDRPPRVVFTSSLLHRFSSPDGFTPKDPTGENTKRPFHTSAINRRYATSKLANILSANKFQREFGAKGIVFSSVHPGALRTEIMREWKSPVHKFMRWAFFYPQEMGPLTQLYAGTAPETAVKGGSYFAPWGREVKPLPVALDPKNQDVCMWLPLTQSMNGLRSRSPSTPRCPRGFLVWNAPLLLGSYELCHGLVPRRSMSPAAHVARVRVECMGARVCRDILAIQPVTLFVSEASGP